MFIENRFCVRAAAIAICVSAMPVVAQDAETPDAREMLKEAVAFYGGLEGVSVHAKMSTKMEGIGMDMESEQLCDLRASKPNRYIASLEGDDLGELKFSSDGERSMIYFGMTGMYLENESAQSFAGAIEEMSLGEPPSLQSSVMMPHILVMTMMRENGYKSLVETTSGVSFVGEEKVGERLANHIMLQSDEMDVGLWFAKGEEQWLLKVAPDMTKLFEQMAEMQGVPLDQMPTIEISIMYNEWAANPTFEEGAFAVEAPETADRAESLDELFGMEGGFADGGMEEESKLLGKQAPKLELDLLDGGKMSLAQHKGKEIVVLDFWATWCPPCREGLPIVTEVTKSFADKGVVFYAVNLQEEAGQVRAFLKEQGIDATVAMDSKDDSSQPFGLDAIPQTYIIGKDGTVQAVHVGLLPNLKERLTEELETLIRGESLVEPVKDESADGDG